MSSPARRWFPREKHWNDASPELQVSALLEAWKVEAQKSHPSLLASVPVFAASTAGPLWRPRATSETIEVNPCSFYLAELLTKAEAPEAQALVWLAANAKFLNERQTSRSKQFMLSWLLHNLSERNPAISTWPLNPLQPLNPFPMEPRDPRGFGVPISHESVVKFAVMNAAETLASFDLVSP